MTAELRKKSVLFVLPYAPRLRTTGFIKYLSKRYDVTVLALITSESEIRAFERSQSYCHEIVYVRQNTRTSIANCLKSLFTGVPLQVAYCHSTDFVHKLNELIANNAFELVHVEMVRIAYVANFIDERIPLVLDCVDTRTAFLKQLIKTRRNPYSIALAAEELIKMRKYEPSICRAYDEVLVATERDALTLKEIDPKCNPLIVKNGVDLELYNPRLKSDHPEADVMFVGWMRYYPNVQGVIWFCNKIWPKVLKAVPHAKFHIVGMDPPPKIQKLAGESIKVTGFVAELHEYVAKAAVSVCPLRTGVGVQNKILEAMAMGLPVITTTVGAMGIDAVPDREIAVADDVNDFADEIIRLLRDQDAARQIGRAGRSYVERSHQWKGIVDSLIGIYDQLAPAKTSLPVGTAKERLS